MSKGGGLASVSTAQETRGVKGSDGGDAVGTPLCFIGGIFSAMEEPKTKQHHRYVDYFKALLMLLVIIAHINFANQAIKPWIYAFLMPAFFFASGMLVKPPPMASVRECGSLMWRKFTALMFPYFLWAIIYASLNGRNLLLILYGSHKSLLKADTLSSLWFLPVLFDAMAFLLLAQMALKERLNLPVKVCLCVVSFCIAPFLPHFGPGYPWCLDVAFAAFGFLLMGNILHPLILRVQRASESSGRVLSIWFAVAVATLAATVLFKLSNPQFGVALMAEARYGNFLLFLLASFLETAFVLSASILLDRLVPKDVSPKVDLLAFIGKNTLCVLVVHKPFIKACHAVFRRIHVPDAIALTVTFAVTAMASCLLALFIHHFFPALVGKTPCGKREMK